jgi:hypothetical protein
MRDLDDLPPDRALPAPGTGHNAGLLPLACDCVEAGMGDGAAFDHIRPLYDPERPDSDILRALARARGGGYEPGPNGSRPAFNPRLLRRFARTSAAEIAEGSPRAHPDLVPPREVAEHLFEGGDVVCVQREVREAGRLFELGDLPGDLSGFPFLGQATFREVGGVPNGDRTSTRCDANVADRRYMVLERDCKEGDPEGPADVERFSTFCLEVARFVPLAMAVDTGGSSVHFWFDVRDLPEAGREEFFSTAVEHGADPRMRVPSQVARTPNVPGEPGRRDQVLLHWDPDGSAQPEGADPRALAAHLRSRGRDRPEPVRTGEWFDSPPPLEPAIVGGLLRRGGKMVLGSSSKGRKTTVLMQLAQCLADGIDFLGMATRRSVVLYCNMELQEAEMCHRGAATRAALEAKEDYWVLNLRGHACDFELLVDYVVEMARRVGAEVIVLDPVYKVEGKRSENANDEVAELLNLFDEVVERTGAAFVFAHHFAKGAQGGKFVEDRISGAGAWWRDPDAGIFMTPLEDEGGFQIACQARSFPPVPEFAARMSYPLMELAEDLDPSNLRTPGPQKKATPAQVAALLPPAGGISHGDWRKLAASELGISGSTFQRRLEEAQALMLVEKDGDLWAAPGRAGGMPGEELL